MNISRSNAILRAVFVQHFSLIGTCGVWKCLFRPEFRELTAITRFALQTSDGSRKHLLLLAES